MAVGRVVLTRSDRQTLARVLVFLNWVSVATGAVLLSLGTYLWAELRRWQDVMSWPWVLWAVPSVLVLTGVSACVVNLVGARLCLDCADMNRFLRWKLVLSPYVGVSLLLTAGVLSVVLLCAWVRTSGTLDRALESGLTSALTRYKDTDSEPGLKSGLDLLQLSMSCCGVQRYQDWFRVQWVPNRYLDQTDPGIRDKVRSNVRGWYLSDSVPFSCCDPASPWPCPQSHLSPASHFLSTRIRSLGLWGRGCRLALGEHYLSIIDTISLTALGVWIFELLVVTGVRYLQTAMESVVRLGDPGCDSEAWILENSFYLDVIKSLGKCYHGDEQEVDPNIDRPIRGPASQPGTRSETKPGTRSETKPGTGSEAEPGTRSEPEPGARSELEPRTRSETKPGTRSEPEPGARSQPEPGTRSQPEPKTRSEPEPGTRSEPEPGTRSETKPETRSEPEPGTRSEPEPKTRSKPEPGTRSEPEPGTRPEPEPETRPETKPGTRYEPKPGARPEPEPGARSEPEPGARSEPEPKTRPEPEPGARPELEPGTRSESEPGTRSEPKPVTESEPEPGTRSEPEPGTRSEPEPGTRSEPEPGTRSEPEPGTRSEPGPEQSH